MAAFQKTIVLMLAASLLAGGLGWTYAYVSERIARYRWVWRLIPVLSVSLPLFIHAAAWEATLGKFGWLQLSAVTSREYAFAGMFASVWIHGVAGAAWVAMIVAFVLRRGPVAGEEAARLESGSLRTALFVVFPATCPLTLLAMMFVALIAATEVSVVDLYAYRTLADEVYFQYALSPEPMPFILATLMPLGIVGVLLAFAFANNTALTRPLRDSSSSCEVALGDASRPALFLAVIVLLWLACLFVLLPLASLVVKAGWTVTPHDGVLVTSWSMERAWSTIATSLSTFTNEFKWSFALAGTAVCITLPIAFGVSILGRHWTKIVICFCFLLLLIPGPVVCVLISRLFSLTDNPLLIDVYERTLIPTAICVLHRSVPACCFILMGAHYMTARNVHEAAKVDGASTWLTLSLIDLPRQAKALGLCILVAGVIAMGEISSTELVLPAGVSTVARRVFGLLHSGVRYQESGLCLISCAFVISLVLISNVVSRVWSRRSANLRR